MISQKRIISLILIIVILGLEVLLPGATIAAEEHLDLGTISDEGTATGATIGGTSDTGSGSGVPATSTAAVKLLEAVPDDVAIHMDAQWLTAQMVLNGNDCIFIEEQQLFTNVTNALNLPSQGPNESTITWTSNSTNYVNTDGTVTRPGFREGPAYVTIYANIQKGYVSTSLTLNLLIPPSPRTVDDPDPDWQYVDLDAEWLTDGRVLAGNEYEKAKGAHIYKNITENLVLPSKGPNDCTIQWMTDNEAVIEANGTIHRPSYSQGNRIVKLEAYIDSGNTESTKARSIEFTFIVKACPYNEAVDLDAQWLVGEGTKDIFADNFYIRYWDEYRNITRNLHLPATAPNGSTITWNSDKPTVLGSDGTVHRPSYANGNKQANLTATVQKDGSWEEVRITVEVLSVLPDNLTVGYDDEWLTKERVAGDYGYLYYGVIKTRRNLFMPSAGSYGSTISWTSDNPAVAVNGMITRPFEADPGDVVTITAVISSGSASRTKSFEIEVVPLPPGMTADQDNVNADHEWLNEFVLTSGNSRGGTPLGLYSGDSLNLPVKGLFGSNINWISSHPEIITTSGSINKPSYSDGGETVTLTAKISSGTSEVMSKTFDKYVGARTATPEEVMDIVKQWLSDELILSGNNSADVKENLYLPSDYDFYTGNYYNRTDITWETSEPDVISAAGKVIRPDVAQGPKTVTLTANIEFEGNSDTKTFVFTVNPKEKVALSAHYDSFTGTEDGLMLLGSTPQESGAIKFTNMTGSAGGAFRKLYLNDDLSFSTLFTFRMTRPYGATTGTGGFEFVMQEADSEISDISDVEPGLSISISTDYTYWESGQASGYLNSGSASVYCNGNKLSIVYPNFPIENIYYIWVEYDGTSKTLDMSFSSTDDKPHTPVIHLDDFELEQIFGNGTGEPVTQGWHEIYAGFSGAYGTALETTEILSWYFKNDPNPVNKYAYTFQDASKITLEAEPEGGQSFSTITATVYGKDGPVADLPVEFFTIAGTMDPVSAVTDSDGKAVATVNADRGGIAIIKAAAGGGALAEKEVQFVLSDEEALEADAQWLSNELVLNGNSSLDNVLMNLRMPAKGINNCDIVWTSSNTTVVAIDGTVNRPQITQGDKSVTLTAVVSRFLTSTGNIEQLVKTFTVKVKVRASDIAAADKAWLTDAIILNGNSSLDNAITDFNLPLAGENGSIISWISSMPGTVTAGGTVHRPTHSQGDRTLILTASIRKESTIEEKTFNITVRALPPNDNEAVFEVFTGWLSDELVLNGNSGFYTIDKNLNLPGTGPYGTIMVWTSTDEAFVALDGTVKIPTLEQGNKSVLLTAAITRGTAVMEKLFYIIIPAKATNMEAVNRDYEWLRMGTILGENISSGDIKSDLVLPEDGPEGSEITWNSSNTEFVASDGSVTRPTWTKGIKWVTLTATLTKGDVSRQKEFVLTLKPLAQTDQEAVDWCVNNLSVVSTLGRNFSNYMVSQDLSLPLTYTYGVTISWTSDKPGLITNEGMITRPEYMQGNKNATLTAVIRKGDIEASTSFVYIVLQKPDTFAPVIISSTPENNSTDNYWNAEDITVIFDENIKAGTLPSAGNTNDLGISLVGAGPQQFSLRITNNMLVITPSRYMDPGLNELIIPQGAVTDLSGNPVQESRISFSVEVKNTSSIAIISSTPGDMEKAAEYYLGSLFVRFDRSEIYEAGNFKGIKMKRAGQQHTIISSTLNGENLMLNVPWLLPGTVYEIIVPEGAVTDRFNNINKEKVIRFRTKDQDGVTEEVTSVYPADKETGIEINENIIVTFGQAVKPQSCALKLIDDKGQPVKVNIKSKDVEQKTIILDPYLPLEPNTKYTITGPYFMAADSTSLEFSSSFTTGGNRLVKKSTSPESIIDKSGAPVNAPVVIEFEGSISKGPNFESIDICDSQGNLVPFDAAETAGRASLTPMFAPMETYTVTIPAGAYKNPDGGVNDAFRFEFSTAGKPETPEFRISPVSSWLTGLPMSFDITDIDSKLKRSGHMITSCEWDFGDGQTGTGSNTSYIYSQAGEYTVRLTFKDNKGFSYEQEKTVNIGDMDISNVTIETDSKHTDYLYIDSVGTSDQNKLFRVYLRYNGGFLSGETISVKLYKRGQLQKELGTITSDSDDSSYDFRFYYEGYDYLEDYELVFTCESLPGKKTLRKPLYIMEYMLEKGSFVFELYDREARSLFQNSDTLEIEVNGEKRVAAREWSGVLDQYVVRDIPTNTTLELKIKEWVLEKDTFFSGQVSGTYFLAGRRTKPGVEKITYQYEKDIHKNEPITFIEGVDTGDVTFRVEGNWNGLEPGYYEVKIDPDGRYLRFSDQNISLNPSRLLGKDKYLMVRMVSKYGSASPWKYLNVRTIPYPSAGDLDFTVRFSKGDYIFSLPLGGSLGNTVAGKLDFLKDIPLLDKKDSFGVDFSGLVQETVFDEELMEANFSLYSTGGGYSKSKVQKKKFKVKTVGYEVEAEVLAEVNIYYWKDRWNVTGSIDVHGYGGYKWTKGYNLPKIGYGVDATLKMGSYVGGNLYVDQKDGSKTKYSGIIDICPTVGVKLQAGPDWLCVASSIHGDIPAEVHIPTGYIEVEANAVAKIYASCAMWSKTLLEKELVKYHWDNGKEKVGQKSLLVGDSMLDNEVSVNDGKLELMSRDYLAKGANWLAGSGGHASRQADVNAFMRSMASGGTSPAMFGTGTHVTDILDNMYPQAEVKLVSVGDKLWMIWNDDNPERSSVNRTQLRYSEFKDGVWSEPAWLGDDGTADFSPVVAAAGDGVLLAWQNVKQPLSDEDSIVSYVKNSAIAVTNNVLDPDSGDVDTVTLEDTDDYKFDHSPRLAADGNKALIVWTKSEGLGFSLGEETDDIQSPENSDRLYWSGWNGSEWSTPEEIEGGLPIVVNSSLAMHGDKGLLLYTLDMDNDPTTGEDQELFTRVFDGASWGPAVRITDNQQKDSNPKAVYCNGDWFIVWHQDQNIMYKEGLAGETRTNGSLSNVESKSEIALMGGSRPQVALIYSHLADGEDLSASIYDAASRTWSGEILLSERDGSINSLSAVFTADEKLNAAFTEAEIVTESVEGVEYKQISNRTGLHLLTYTPVHDLALDSEAGIDISSIPRPGAVETITVTVLNKGDFAEYPVISLYDGDPASGGIKIGEAAAEKPVPARTAAEMSIEWLVGQRDGQVYDIYVVVNTEDGAAEADTSNNILYHRFTAADIIVSDVSGRNVGKYDYIISGIVTNVGSVPISEFTVRIDQGIDGTPLETAMFNDLAPGRQVQLSMLVSSEGLARDENGIANVTLRALLPVGVPDNSEENNVFDFALKPAKIVVESSSHRNDETQVDIEKPLSVGFNMPVEAGSGYGNVVLLDDGLNSVPVIKSLDGSTLTVTPESPLRKDTTYTLVIPADAVGDSYGHRMENDYNLSFTTTSSSPEVIFAYPGDSMENVAANEQIRLKYNQKVAAGLTYEGVVLYGSDAGRVPARVSIEDEWLHIKPAAKLQGNVQYSVVVPAGAVKNHDDELQREEYRLTFTTGLPTPVEDDDSGKSSGSNIEQPLYRVTSQVSDDGSITRIIDIDNAALQKLKADNSTVTLNVSKEIKVGDKVQVRLSGDLLQQLAAEGNGISIVTGRGDVMLPAALIQALYAAGNKDLTIVIGENRDNLPDNGRVSTGIFDFSILSGGKPVTRFEPKVRVTIPLDTARIGDTRRVIACVYDEATGTWQPVGSVADAAAGMLVFYAPHFSAYAAFETPVHFDDVTSSWAKEKVEILASRRLIEGKGKNTFAPNDVITRAEFTAMTVRSLYIELTGGKGILSDVPAGAWYSAPVETAYQIGLVEGNGQSLFVPGSQITREQLAVITYRLCKYKNGDINIDKSYGSFRDEKDISDYASEAVKFVAAAGIMTGSGGKFGPKRGATRQEAAVVLYRLLEYLGEL